MPMTRTAMLSTAVILLLFSCIDTLRADPATGKIIADIQPQGNRLHSPERILAMMSMKPGKRFSDMEAQEDVNRLMRSRLFMNVQINTRAVDADRVVVLVLVQELPSTIQDIIYEGAYAIGKDELDTLTGLRRGVPLSPLANQAAAQAILRKYHEKGYLYASVELAEGRSPSDTRVLFLITEGPVVKINSFSFVGNDSASTGRLKTQITSSKAFLGRIGGKLNTAQLEHDVHQLTTYYRNLGYHNVRISRELVPTSRPGSVDVVFHIDEGPRHQIGSVQVEGNRLFTEAQLLAHAANQPGQFYDKGRSAGDIDTIKKMHGYHGFRVGIQENVYSVEGKPGVVNVVYQVQETNTQPDRIGDIRIYGNRVTKDNVIRRQLTNANLLPGSVLSYPDIAVAENNLSRLGIFRADGETRPTISVVEHEGDSPFKDLEVRVEEQPTGSFMLGVGVNSDAGLNGSIVLNEKNFDLFRFPTSLEDILAGRAFRGAGQEFRLEAVPGTEFQRYTATFREPSLLDSPYSLSLSGYYFNRAFQEYTEDRLGMRMGVGRRLNNIWSANFTTRLESVNVRGVSIWAPPEIQRDVGQSLIIGLSGGLTRDTRDSFLRATTGSIIDLRYEQVFGDYDFPSATLEASKYWTVYQRNDGSGKHVLAARTQLGFTGSNAPVYERLYGGGFRSLRGFQFRGMGPITPTDFNIGGTFSFLNSVEYQVPVLAGDQIYVVGFLDSGTVETDVAIRDYRVTAGVGLRLTVPMMGPVPIALDFGFPIVRGEFDRKQVFSFYLGFFN